MSPSQKIYYPFKPLVATPSMKYFCPKKNTISIGSSTIVDAAIIRLYSVPYIVVNVCSPRASVKLDELLRYIKGFKKSSGKKMNYRMTIPRKRFRIPGGGNLITG